MQYLEILQQAIDQKASDIFLVAGFALAYKIGGIIRPQSDQKLMPQDTEELIKAIYQATQRPDTKFRDGDDDFAFSVPGLSRFRVSAYRQRNSYAAVIRVIPFGIPDYRQIGIPEEVMNVSERRRGLVLITGPAGGGKSTTLACIIDRINRNRNGHIITLEDPIEYLHRNEKSIVSQREIGLDTEDYVTGLRACLRQAPDVILLGEMRDLETIRTALTAAETGHLVISTLHTTGAANSVERIVDVFPPEQQQQIRLQLAMLLQSVISQRLVPTVDGSLLPAFEIMHANNAIRTMIRESKTHQFDSVITAGTAEGMLQMDACLLQLLRSGKITAETAVKCALNPEALQKKISAIGTAF